MFAFVFMLLLDRRVMIFAAVACSARGILANASGLFVLSTPILGWTLCSPGSASHP
jgi:uncharacterized membrane protein